MARHTHADGHHPHEMLKQPGLALVHQRPDGLVEVDAHIVVRTPLSIGARRRVRRVLVGRGRVAHETVRGRRSLRVMVARHGFPFYSHMVRRVKDKLDVVVAGLAALSLLGHCCRLVDEDD